jgi:hypothetical protein
LRPVIATSVTPTRFSAEDRGELVDFARIGYREHDVARRHHAEGRRGWLGRVHEHRRRAVDASVAAILRATWPLLPMPITTTRPGSRAWPARRARSSRPGCALRPSKRTRLDLEGLVREPQCALRVESCFAGTVRRLSFRMGRL